MPMEETESDLKHKPPHCVVACIEALAEECPSWLEPYARHNRGDMDHVGGMIALALEERGLVPRLQVIQQGESVSKHMLDAQQVDPGSFRGVIFQTSDLLVSNGERVTQVQLHVVAALPIDGDQNVCSFQDVFDVDSIRHVPIDRLDNLLPDLPPLASVGYVVYGLKPEDPQASDPDVVEFLTLIRRHKATIRT